MKKFAKVSFLVLFGFGVFLGPVSSVFAQTQDQDPFTGGQTQQPDYENNLQDCNILNSDGFVACLVKGFYYLILYPSGWFAKVSAQLLDVSIAYSLDSDSYSQDNGGFITKGWGIIRDIANVMFIFILLYIAIRHILQLGTSETKKLLLSIIIAALLINFSLFFSKVIIDGGNILARAFYHNIEVQYDDQLAGEGIKSISQALAEKVQPQKILGAELFQPSLYPSPEVPDDKIPNGYAFFIMLVSAFVNITMGIVFLSVFLLFVARVVGLWFLMIFSPIAFASIAVPGGGGSFGEFGWDKWKKAIFQLSFMAPVFLFFLFLTIMFLNVILNGNSIFSGNTDTSQRLAGVLIPFALIVVLLKQAKKIAVDMSGEFGKQITGAIGKLAGIATVAATGGTAFVGRAVVGRAASGALQRGNFEARIADAETRAKNQDLPGIARWKARQEANGLRAMQSRAQALRDSSFDIRNADKSKLLGGAVGATAGFLGKNLIRPTMKDMGGSDFNAGKGGKESRKKFEDDKEKEKLKRAEELSTVRFGEGKAFREAHEEDIEQEKKDREALKKSFADQNKVLADELSTINKKVLPTEEDLKRSEEIKVEQEELKTRESKIMDQVNKRIKQKEETDPIKEEAQRRRELYAGYVEGKNIWGGVMGVDRKEIAHNIRKGKKSKSDEDRLKEALEAINKDKDKDKKPKGDSDDEKPKPGAPSGGGGGGN